MKILQIVKAFLPVVFMLMAMYAGFNAAHTHNQEQSGWMMMCMFSCALIVVTLGISHGIGWDGLAVVILAIMCGLIFATHFLWGIQGVAVIVHSIGWICHKISQGYADTFH